MSALSDLLVEARTKRGVSDRQVARMARERGHTLNNDTVSTYMSGDHGKPSEPTLRAFSEVLGIPMRKLRAAADLPTYAERYEPPPEADRLTPRQRKAVNELIRSMVEPSEAGRVPAGSVARSTALRPVQDADLDGLAADEQQEEPAGQRLRREQDEAAERADR